MHRFHESDEIDWERLDRFVCGRGTVGEQGGLAEWAGGDPRRVALAAAMRTIGRSHARSAFRPEAQPALARIQRRLRTIPSAQRS
jgi:hypothetical protein